MLHERPALILRSSSAGFILTRNAIQVSCFVMCIDCWMMVHPFVLTYMGYSVAAALLLHESNVKKYHD